MGRRKKRILIIGAGGRDFHNFNVIYRDNPDVKVVAFTAAQIPGIDKRKYPRELAGKGYYKGIPIVSESQMAEIIKKYNVDEVIFSYSDVKYSDIAKLARIAKKAGAEFVLPDLEDGQMTLKLGGLEKIVVKTTRLEDTMIRADAPVLAISAARTGCGKSQTTRYAAKYLKDHGFEVIVVRHPMPYGNLNKQKVQRYSKLDDLVRHDCTIEEMEEYEPHIMAGNILYAGVDYKAILTKINKEIKRETKKDPKKKYVILWDGGNNDIPFYKPDLWITVVDPHRAGHDKRYYPGRVNTERADVVIVNKVDSVKPEKKKHTLEKMAKNIKYRNKNGVNALIIYADSPVVVAQQDKRYIKGKRVLVIEDGPTLTHGEMKFGAGYLAAKKYGAASIVNASKYAVGSIADTYKKYGAKRVLPAMGYGKKQIADLRRTIERAIKEDGVDTVIIGTPIDLSRVIGGIEDAEFVRATYKLKPHGRRLDKELDKFIDRVERRQY